jgi:hypothetical protein
MKRVTSAMGASVVLVDAVVTWAVWVLYRLSGCWEMPGGSLQGDSVSRESSRSRVSLGNRDVWGAERA